MAFEIICCTAGKTVDGREIKESTIDSMAQTYDPKLKTALLNYEHFITEISFGHVTALRSDDGYKGIRSLYAQIEPNDQLIKFNKEGRGLYSSAEILEEFPTTGKPYLYMLAITNEPACLALDRIEFLSSNCQKRDLRNSLITPALQFSLQEIKPIEINTQSKVDEESFFSRLNGFFNKKKEEEMPEINLDEFTQKIEESIKKAISPLQESFRKKDQNKEEDNFVKKFSEQSNKIAKLEETNKEKDTLIETLSQRISNLEALSKEPAHTAESDLPGSTEKQYGF